tara:strand:- start:4513 stop:5010 length:498 start_codon:yes stop_codon:yes gene_type:complete
MNAEQILEKLAITPVPARDRAPGAWCEGCANQLAAARKYNIDMSNFFEYCARDMPIAALSIDMQNAVVLAAIRTQMKARDAGLYDGKIDGKIGPNTIEAMTQLDGETALNDTIFFNRFDPGMPCPPARDIDVQPEQPTTDLPQSVGMGAIAIIALAAGAYFFLRS